VATLRDEIADLRAELAEARQRITDLEQRVHSSPSSPAGPSGTPDWRDARILDALDPGEVVTLPELRDIVTSETDITADDTARERIKRVTDTEAFENIGPRHRPRWRYLGDTTDTDS
jgi:hypothetical protein